MTEKKIIYRFNDMNSIKRHTARLLNRLNTNNCSDLEIKSIRASGYLLQILIEVLKSHDFETRLTALEKLINEKQGVL